MTKLTPEAAKSVLEDRVSKIVKAIGVLKKDGPRIADILDDAALLKTERFLQARLGDLIRDLATARAARQTFSLDAEPEPPATAAQVLDQFISREHAPRPNTGVMPPRPQLAVNNEDRPRWTPPIGRLVGTKEPVYGPADTFTQPKPTAEEADFIDE